MANQIQTSVKDSDWKKLCDEWKQAKTDLGVITPVTEGNQEKSIELWRAKTDLPKYISWVDGKREAIRDIWEKVRAFKPHTSTSSLSVLLEADPGVGKTFLGKCLSKQIGFELVEHDISQMVQREELLDLFEMISAKQAESDKPVFVFVDEINASLAGSPVYGAFLSPLEGRKYMRRGRPFELKPCIWMFAGTPERGSDVDQRSGQSQKEKREDFESRLTMVKRIDYASLKNECGRDVETEATRLDALDKQARLEQVYMGAQWINNFFNDVVRVDENIFEVFRRLDPSTAPLRQIKRLAGSLENVQYGRVNIGNCTSMEWRDTIVKHWIGGMADWQNKSKNKPEYVTIVLK